MKYIINYPKPICHRQSGKNKNKVFKIYSNDIICFRQIMLLQLIYDIDI